ncbi:methyl-accepting chemotaxis protein [Vibrio gallaecicus]|uniref:methyl-accepting chemotaxis protein n=1 Tax=Vibrio gallaecicus TaxID=552386 RepID=UPI00142DC300|nr:methyl-accepting chemotaxis protein [Vibrio gallaecicus]MDN3615761.1 methyl-accepting chemotaxis protein [Vibrio gallaecicus]MDN3615907.1 methyl-accepting chemotaxis protein [Vibrio gallaecicus]MDN3617747.1 methyl-accepting chemotaxis protein [Vibrio gallaecicus]
MKFSQKILLASSLLLLSSIALLTAMQAYTVRKELEVIEHTSLNQMVKEMTNVIALELQSKKNLARFTTETVQYYGDTLQEVQNVIETSILKENFIAVGFGEERSGSFVENDDNWQAGSDYDPRTRPWYQQSASKQQLIVTEPYIDVSTRTTVISIGTPVFQNKQFVGSMFFDVDLSGLSDLVGEVHLFNASDFFIMTDKGITIAHPDTSKNGEEVTSYIPDINLHLKDQKIELNERLYQIRIAEIPGQNWLIGAIVDEEKAYQSVYKMRNTSLLYGLVAALVSVVILSLLIKYLIRPIHILNDAIENVASGEGDLTKRLDTNTDREFVTLAEGFNAFANKIQTQIIESKQLGQEILEVTEVTVAGSKKSVGTMNQQLQELEQLASAMNEMSVTASEVANNAQGAASAAKDAGDATERGSNAMSETGTSIDFLASQIEQALIEMQNLEAATANIETVLNVINDIASQTNLLALNAAIEAARAGDSGRGFAVVADEVRTLAQRTQDSTSEIGSLIEHLQSGARTVSSAMDQSKQSTTDAVTKAKLAELVLEEIKQEIDRITEVSIQIASAAEEQSLVSEEINGNTLRIKELSTDATNIAENASKSLDNQQSKILEQDHVLNRFIV